LIFHCLPLTNSVQQAINSDERFEESSCVCSLGAACRLWHERVEGYPMPQQVIKEVASRILEIKQDFPFRVGMDA
jgi:hypothetical protein